MKTFITHRTVITPNGELATMEGRIKAFGWFTANLFLWLSGRSKTETIYGLLIEEVECPEGVFQHILKSVNQKV